MRKRKCDTAQCKLMGEKAATIIKKTTLISESRSKRKKKPENLKKKGMNLKKTTRSPLMKQPFCLYLLLI